MSNFQSAIPIILKHEGGFVDNKNDSGGATNYGISMRLLKTLAPQDGFLDFDLDHDGTVDINDIKKMTPELATNFYRTEFWDKYGYSRITDQVLATKVFDMTVNMGSKQSHTLLQRACWSIGGYGCIQDDGILGDKSIALINEKNPLIPFRSEIAGFYRFLVAKNPSYEEFKIGWLKRGYA